MNRFWLVVLAALGGFALLGGGAAVALNFADKASWAKYVWAQIATALPFLSLRARLMVLAQAAYESGWGTSSSLTKLKTNNLFNITTNAPAVGKVGTDGWKGQWIQQADADDEYAADGTKKRISQKWRVYPSYAASISDYWAFIGNPRYAAQGVRAALEAGDVPGFVNALYRGGYFTLAPSTYLASFQGVMSTATKFLGLNA